MPVVADRVAASILRAQTPEFLGSSIHISFSHLGQNFPNSPPVNRLRRTERRTKRKYIRCRYRLSLVGKSHPRMKGPRLRLVNSFERCQADRSVHHTSGTKRLFQASEWFVGSLVWLGPFVISAARSFGRGRCCRRRPTHPSNSF